jgi:glycosyltransferase involved in cell wall biosynthesis
MPEIAGDAAMIIDPFKPEQITDALIQITNNQSLRKQLIERGLQQSAKFSWKAMAKDVLAIYKEIDSSTYK